MQSGRALIRFILLSLFLQCIAYGQIANMSIIAKAGDQPAQGNPFTGVNQPSINNKQQVTFLAASQVDKFVGLYTQTNIFAPSPQPQIIANNRMISPVGGSFLTITFPKVNNKGDILFTSPVVEGSATGGLFLFTQGEISIIALDDAPTPIGGQYSLLSRSSLFTFNNNQEIVFLANVAKDGGITPAIFLKQAGQIIKVVANGDTLPDGQVISFKGTAPTINNRGDVLFSAATTTNPDKTNIYLFSQGSLRPVIRPGDAAPQGGNFDNVITTGRYLNDSRQVAFLGTIGGKTGIYLATLDDSFMVVKLDKLIADGETAPDGGIFKDIKISLTSANGGLGNKGQLVFRGTTTKNIYGLYLYKAGQIVQIVAQGMTTPVGGIFPSDAAFNCAFLGTIISDNDEVVFEATITGSMITNKALFLWTPQPHSAPAILNAIYKKKQLIISAFGVDSSTQVEINGILSKVAPVVMNNNSQLVISGTRKKLKLQEKGTNSVVLIANGFRSMPFNF